MAKSLPKNPFARSSATNKNSLYDSYIRAIKWASLRIKDRGVIAYVTNGGWLDANVGDGMRKTLAEEFSDIYVLNLRGNARTAGEQRKKEAGNVFGSGGRTTTAVAVLVKDPAGAGPATIHYTDIGDYLSAHQKLAKVADAERVTGLEPVTHVTPNEHGDWLNQRSDDFDSFISVGEKDGGPAVFTLFSGGLKTNRDAWVYNAGSAKLERNVRRLIATYESDRVAGHTSKTATSDPTRIAWSGGLQSRLDRRLPLFFDALAIRAAAYRPFARTAAYFDPSLNERRYRLSTIFPTAAHGNGGFYQVGAGSAVPFSVLALSNMPDLHVTGAGSGGQFFARWRYEAVDSEDGTLELGTESDGDEVVDGYRRIDNITDEALTRFRSAYGDEITKDDVFHYVYGLLHSPDYRSRYAADLKKSLPRIPLVTDARPYIDAGERLMELHLGYESIDPYPLDGLDITPPDGADPYAFYAVGDKKMRFGKPTDAQKAEGLKKDRTVIHYNDRITLSGIPEDAYRYMLGSRSAIEWIIDRYHVKTDKASGIVNDPNDWSRGVSDPRYIIDLLARIVTVSLETMAIVDSLPTLEIREDQG